MVVQGAVEMSNIYRLIARHGWHIIQRISDGDEHLVAYRDQEKAYKAMQALESGLTKFMQAKGREE